MKKSSKQAHTRKDAPEKPKRKLRIIVYSSISALIVAIAAFAIIADRVAPFRVAVVTVDENTVTMRTFVRRLYATGQDPMELLMTIANEEMVKIVAPEPPYNIDVAEADVDAFLKDVARGSSDTISDDEYREWYRQRLNESLMPEHDFRDLMRTTVLMQKLGDYLRARVPTVAEQVLLYMIPVGDLAEAREALESINDGESFSAVSEKYGNNRQLREAGGRMGWFPRGTLTLQIENVVFDELATGGVSDPIYLDDQTFGIVKVAERNAAREISPEARIILQNRALEMWLNEQQDNHEIEFGGLRGSYNSETDAWVKWQLERMKR